MRFGLAVFVFVTVAVSVTHGFDFFGLFGGGKKAKKRDYKPVSDDKANKYLQNFGYVQPSAFLHGASGMAGDFADVKTAFKNAVKKFQEFAGLKTTGELDLQTKKKMAEPRCGVLDVRAISTTREAAFKWKKDHLTYSIQTYSPDLPHDDIKKAIKQAFDTWSGVVPLDFTEVPANDESADIKVKFAPGSHGDPWPFDGAGGVLAHATMPTSGLLHFDDDETWTYMNPQKIAKGNTDLFAVAIHESGHALGLDHSRDEDSIMAPFYKETVDDSGNYIMPKLKTGDIQAIQDIYGPRRGGRPATPPPAPSGGRGGEFGNNGWSSWDRDTTTQRPTTKGGFFGSGWSLWPTTTTRRPSSSWSNWSSWSDSDSNGNGFGDRGRTRTGGRNGGGSSSGGSSGGGSSGGGTEIGGSGCPSRIDAVSSGPGSSKYIFSGGNVFEYSGGRVTKTHSLRLLFPKGPIYVDAALSNDRTSTLMLFMGYNVYAFHYDGRVWNLDRDFPKRVPREIGFRPNGGILWNDGQQVLFSDDGQFALYDEYWNQATKVDRISNYFPDFPQTVKGGFSSSGSEMKLFSGSRAYTYDASRKIGVGQPQTLTSFFKC